MEEGNCNPSTMCPRSENSSEMDRNVDVGLPAPQSADQNNNSDKFSMDQDFTNNNSDQVNGRRLRTRSKNRRLFPEKVHHKRQTLQAMARPLKQWLLQNGNNPYPTKQQKQLLARNNDMTLVQVCNWFANARRRVKNAVQQPNLSWGDRVKKYNNSVEGNAELLSISSEEPDWDIEQDNEVQENNTFQYERNQVTPPTDLNQSDDTVPSPATPITLEHNIVLPCEQYKFKDVIMNRYLNDPNDPHNLYPDEKYVTLPDRARRQSGSLGSQDYEEMSTSSASSRILHRINDDFSEEELYLNYRNMPQAVNSKTCNHTHSYHDDDAMRQMEIDAVVALTTLANSHIRRDQDKAGPERVKYRM